MHYIGKFLAYRNRPNLFRDTISTMTKGGITGERTEPATEPQVFTWRHFTNLFRADRDEAVESVSSSFYRREGVSQHLELSSIGRNWSRENARRISKKGTASTFLHATLPCTYPGVIRTQRKRDSWLLAKNWVHFDPPLPKITSTTSAMSFREFWSDCKFRKFVRKALQATLFYSTWGFETESGNNLHIVFLCSSREGFNEWGINCKR